jgi:hypothetical protein
MKPAKLNASKRRRGTFTAFERARFQGSQGWMNAPRLGAGCASGIDLMEIITVVGIPI